MDKTRAEARRAGADVAFFVDDLTRLQHVHGEFDILVDYGTFDELSVRQRQAYLENIIPLARPGAQFLLWAFEGELRPWERFVQRILPFGNIALDPGYVERLFAAEFDITRIAGGSGLWGWPRGWAA